MKTNDPPAGTDTLSGISAEAQTILPTGREGSNVLDMQTRLAPESRVEGNDTLKWRFQETQSLFASEMISLHFVCILDFFNSALSIFFLMNTICLLSYFKIPTDYVHP